MKFNENATCAARIKADGTQDWFNLGEELFVGDFPDTCHLDPANPGTPQTGPVINTSLFSGSNGWMSGGTSSQ